VSLQSVRPAEELGSKIWQLRHAVVNRSKAVKEIINPILQVYSFKGSPGMPMPLPGAYLLPNK